MYLRLILYAFLIYLLYRFIFHFVIPVYKTTKQVKKQFRDIHSKMEEQMNQQSAHSQTSGSSGFNDPKKSGAKERGGDYIDFEEVK